MVRYRRNFIAGGTYFFTVTLADRRSAALTDHIGALRTAFRTTRRVRPFDIDAIVVLPDPLHIVMTLPVGDADFSNRWRLIKRRFTDALTRAGSCPCVIGTERLRYGSVGSGSTLFVTAMISNGMSTTSISIRSNTAWSNEFATGSILHFITMCGMASCPAIGAERLTRTGRVSASGPIDIPEPDESEAELRGRSRISLRSMRATILTR